MEDLKKIIRPLYEQCFTAKGDVGQVPRIMGELLTEDFQSVGSVETKTKLQLIGQVQFFWKLIPDLTWAPQEILQDGHRVIVRSIATGSPSGDFMGLPTNGSKSFKIMTIDVHTFTGNRVSSVHHLEDWVTAMKQLKG